MSIYKQQEIHVTERRSGSIRTEDLDALQVLTVSDSGVRVAHLVDEEAPRYEIGISPVTDGSEVNVDDADRVVVGANYVVAFRKEEEER